MFAQLSVSNGFAQLSPEFYTRLQPRGLNHPSLLHVNNDVAGLLGLNQAQTQSDEFLQIMSGNAPLPGGVTLSAVYSGHQFGVWAGQLGDGRAHLLGAVAGHDVNGLPCDWELQLKGAGLTPYSRMGDGRAVLRSSVREYLASAAMVGLGIPTTLALCITQSDDPVYRETTETAAIVTRVAPSFVRFGSFEHWYANRRPDLLRELLNYVVSHFFADEVKVAQSEADLPAMVCGFLDSVIKRTALLMADWQCVGFCHGVMNTDNMSILGLTIDYGPYGFMDGFQANHICNHSDTEGRYAWNQQASAGLWNLYRLANCFISLGVPQEALIQCLDRYEPIFTDAFREKMICKMGLVQWQEGDEQLLEQWWQMLHTQKADFTLSFRYLSEVMQDDSRFLSLFSDQSAAQQWLQQYKARIAGLEGNEQERVDGMNAVNPLYVLRNYLAEKAIWDAKRKNPATMENLLTVLRSPYVEHAGMEQLAALPPEWANEIAVSCSS